MATANAETVKVVVTSTDPVLVVAEIAFSTGAAAVTAESLGMTTITGFAGGTWGMTTTLGASITTKTALVAGIGVTTVDLECVDDASNMLTETATVLFWGVR